MSYSVEYEPEALANLDKLTQAVRTRIINKINWLAANFDQMTPMPLTGNLAGFYKLKVGDYRVIYDFSIELKMIAVDRVGQRREIYD